MSKINKFIFFILSFSFFCLLNVERKTYIPCGLVYSVESKDKNLNRLDELIHPRSFLMKILLDTKSSNRYVKLLSLHIIRTKLLDKFFKDTNLCCYLSDENYFQIYDMDKKGYVTKDYVWFDKNCVDWKDAHKKIDNFSVIKNKLDIFFKTKFKENLKNLKITSKDIENGFSDILGFWTFHYGMGILSSMEDEEKLKNDKKLIKEAKDFVNRILKSFLLTKSPYFAKILKREIKNKISLLSLGKSFVKDLSSKESTEDLEKVIRGFTKFLVGDDKLFDLYKKKCLDGLNKDKDTEKPFDEFIYSIKDRFKSKSNKIINMTQRCINSVKYNGLNSETTVVGDHAEKSYGVSFKNNLKNIKMIVDNVKLKRDEKNKIVKECRYNVEKIRDIFKENNLKKFKLLGVEYLNNEHFSYKHLSKEEIEENKDLIVLISKKFLSKLKIYFESLIKYLNKN